VARVNVAKGGNWPLFQAKRRNVVCRRRGVFVVLVQVSTFAKGGQSLSTKKNVPYASFYEREKKADNYYRKGGKKDVSRSPRARKKGDNIGPITGHKGKKKATITLTKGKGKNTALEFSVKKGGILNMKG